MPSKTLLSIAFTEEKYLITRQDSVSGLIYTKVMVIQ